MKKLVFILASVAVLSVVSCREEKPKTETVIIEKPVEKEKTVIIEKEKEKEPDGTSLSVDKNGVEFSSKKGDKKTEVIIK